MKRLLYICSDFGIKPDGTKGASIHLRAITEALANDGHDVRVLSPHAGPSGRHPAGRLLPAGCAEVMSTTKQLKSWLDARDYDISVARELRGLMYNTWVQREAAEAARAFAPHAIIERLSLCGHVGVDVADEIDVPLILEVNALLTAESRQFRGLALQDLAESIERRVLHRADAIMAVSRPLADQITQRGVDAAKIHVVPNGVDLAKFDGLPERRACQRALGIDSPFVVGFCGSLKVWHGVDVLVEAFARIANDMPGAHLLIVGSGPQEQALRDAVAAAGLTERATLTGAVSHDDVPLYVRAMDVGVAPFKHLDTFYFSPIKLFEYMAAGACVVASDLGQIAEVIDHDATGVLCTPDDSAVLARALAACAADARRREEIAGRAAQLVEAKYTWAHTARQTMDIIESRLRGSDRTLVPSGDPS